MTGECEFRVHDCLAQIDMLDPQIGAWEFVDRDGALDQARKLDNSTEHGPLFGLTIGVKDIIDVAGMPTRFGSPIYADNIARTDAIAVAMARSAGAIIIGKTVSTELATFVPSRTKNPQNLEYSPGGSSSGSAAAVAAGMVSIALGTQTAGSIIRPAAYCGVVGYKPTFGMAPLTGVKVQSQSLDTLGMFSRTIEEAINWYAAMTGTNPAMLTPSRGRVLRVKLIGNLMNRADVDMAVAMAEAADALKAAGCSVTESNLPPLFDEIFNDQRTVQMAENARCYATERTSFRGQVSPKLLAQLDEGVTIADTDYHDALDRISNARRIADQYFADCDAWLMPSATGAAPKGYESTGEPIFNRVVTALHTPAINLPVYRSKNRMPLGLQLVGARHQDEKLLLNAHRIIQILRSATHD